MKNPCREGQGRGDTQSVLEDHGQEIVDAAAPHAPVVAAGEGAADHVQLFILQHFVVIGKRLVELVLRAHGPVEHPEAVVEFFFFIQQRQVLFFAAPV